MRMQHIDFELRGEFIPLDALLKATGLADNGGAAKAMVAAGKVEVDGQQELRKTAKLRAGQVVAIAGTRVRILAPGTGVDMGTGTEADAGLEAGAGK